MQLVVRPVDTIDGDLLIGGLLLHTLQQVTT